MNQMETASRMNINTFVVMTTLGHTSGSSTIRIVNGGKNMTIKKVKITENEKEVEGEVITKRITEFGTSGHIIVPKQFIGKVANVIIPQEQKLKWRLSYG